MGWWNNEVGSLRSRSGTWVSTKPHLSFSPVTPVYVSPSPPSISPCLPWVTSGSHAHSISCLSWFILGMELCSPTGYKPPSLSLIDSCATSILATVDTSTSWSVTATSGSTNTSGSLVPTPRPLRSNPSAAFSSNPSFLPSYPCDPLLPIPATRCWINCIS